MYDTDLLDQRLPRRRRQPEVRRRGRRTPLQPAMATHSAHFHASLESLVVFSHQQVLFVVLLGWGVR